MRDGPVRHVHRPRYIYQFLSKGEPLLYFKGLCLSYFRVYILCPANAATSGYHVIHIFLLTAKIQMIGPNTTSIVTTMQHHSRIV